MKHIIAIFTGLILSSAALAHGHEPGEPGAEDVTLTCGRTITSAQVNVELDREDGTLKVTLPNGNQAEGRYVKTTNVRDSEILYVLNTGGTLIADLSFLRSWVSSVDQVVVRESNAQYNLAFNVANYASCTVVVEP